VCSTLLPPRSGVVRDPLAHSTPLDRSERARRIFLAQLERRTKEIGRKNGALGNIGVEVLGAALFRFADRRTGLCFPELSHPQVTPRLNPSGSIG
jgi:hypothetical protein